MWSIGEFQRRRARANRPLGGRIDFFNGLLFAEQVSVDVPPGRVSRPALWMTRLRDVPICSSTQSAARLIVLCEVRRTAPPAIRVRCESAGRCERDTDETLGDLLEPTFLRTSGSSR